MQELPALEALSKAYAPDGFTLIGINGFGDALPWIRETAARRGTTFPTVIDDNGALVKAVSVTAIPRTLLIDQNGTVVGDWLGAVKIELVQEHLVKLGLAQRPVEVAETTPR